MLQYENKLNQEREKLKKFKEASQEELKQFKEAMQEEMMQFKDQSTDKMDRIIEMIANLSSASKQ